MPADSNSRASRSWESRLGILFPVVVMLSVVVLVVPLRPLALDLLLACNITLAVVILLTAIRVSKPLEFSVFPVLLLGTTLFRLVLNIASTRLILSRGATHQFDAAGGIIQAFGEFVAGGNLVVGLVLFAILVAIQFLVITKGATRISEVAARFTLDGLPGKQLAIDADLNSGQIDHAEAHRRRDELSRQADFHGAMDGASKFVRGDALAGIVITFVNLIAGLYIGLVQHGLPLDQAAGIFAVLTIGDGLVSQIPAFLIALAAGFLVTRTTSESNLSQDAAGQLIQSPSALIFSGVLLLILSLTGLPGPPLLLLAAGCLGMGYLLSRPVPPPSADATPADDSASGASLRDTPNPLDRLHVEPLELILGIGLLRLTRDEEHGLLSRIAQMRRDIAQELGLIVPSVRIRDDLTLPRNAYRIRLRGVEIAHGTAYPDGLLALETPRLTGRIPGIELASRSSASAAKWIERKQEEAARAMGYRVVEPAAAIAIRFGEILREHADLLLTRQQVHELLDRLRLRSPRMIEELVPHVLAPGLIQQVLKHLLRERVPIRDLETILQVLSDGITRQSSPWELTETVRAALGGLICQQYREHSLALHAITFTPRFEHVLRTAIRGTDDGPILQLPERDRSELVERLETECNRMIAEGNHPLLLCESGLRVAVKRLIEPHLPRVAVLGREEISRETIIRNFVELEHGPVSEPVAYRSPAAA
jgi:flagellar biosynthesis protein FlhA